MWRAAHSQDENYVTEGIISYFFDILNKFDCSKCLLLWDSGKSRWRTSMYPDYKASREDRKNEFDLEEMGKQKEEAKRILEYFGVRNITVPGVEADDLIAWFSEYFSKDYRVIIASRDKDLWQLINSNVSVYDPLSGKFIREETVKEEIGIEPFLIPSWKALTGDIADNIKGVKGIGDKTAVKLLEVFGDVSNLLDPVNSKELKLKKTSAKVLSQSDNLEHSYKLVKLPSLFDMYSFLDEDEKQVLTSELNKEVVVNNLKAQVELDLLQNGRIKRRFVDGSFDFTSFIKDLEFNRGRIFDIGVMEKFLHECCYCSLCLTSKDTKLYPKGPLNAKIMILGKGIGLNTDSDSLVDSMFDVLSVNKNNCWITSACKCDPHYMPVEYSCLNMCSKFIETEVGQIKPKLIIVLGNDAMSLVTPYKTDVSKRIGEISKYNVFGIDCFVSILPDPLVIVRDSKLKADWDYGVSKIKDFLDERRKK